MQHDRAKLDWPETRNDRYRRPTSATDRTGAVEPAVWDASIVTGAWR